MSNIFEEIQNLAKSDDSKMYIELSDGTIEELKPGMVNGRVFYKTSKNELNRLLFNKERVGLEEIKSLNEIDFSKLKEDLVKLLYTNLSYPLKKQAVTEIPEIITKYDLKEISSRKKKEE